MGAFVPLIGPVLGLLGQVVGGGSEDPPEAPAPIAPPEPPAAPPPPVAKDPQETILAEQDRIRGLRRRRAVDSKPITSLTNTSNTSSKTLLGE